MDAAFLPMLFGIPALVAGISLLVPFRGQPPSRVARVLGLVLLAAALLVLVPTFIELLNGESGYD